MGAPPLLTPLDLRCDRIVTPFGVESSEPRLSWKFAPLAKPATEARQTAYQVLAATTRDKLSPGIADLWENTRTLSDDTLHVPYAGAPVAPGARIWWTIRAWDAHGNPGPWAEPTWWETALTPADWSPARWISSPLADPDNAPCLRRSFTLPAPPLRARVHVCGLGYHELYINGIRCGDAVLEPAQTDYDCHALYVTHDVTAHLATGANAIGLILGNGWFHQDKVWKGGFEPYGKPGALLKLSVTCDGGSIHEIVSDGNWLAAAGPIVFNNVYAGERYDARRELPGWAQPATPPGDWQPVKEVAPLAPALRPQQLPPIRRTQFLPALSRRQISKGTWVYDFGQNFAGWTRLQVEAPRGTEVCLRFAEDIFADGSLNPLSTGVVHTRFVQTDRYLCHGRGPEIWEPRFTYHGFRYVEVTGLAGEPPLDLLEGVVVHTDFASAGEFTCSDPLLNRLHETARWTLRGNLHGVPTDCPARERCGWLGDAHTIAELTLLHFDSLTFWRKYHRDILNSRGHGNPAEPRVPANIAPGQRHCGQANPDWAVALVLIPWQLYVYTDDQALLRETYPDLRNFTDWLEETAVDYIVLRGYGDWCPPGLLEPKECPVALSSTAFYFHTVSAMAAIARALDRPDDARHYTALAQSIRTAFHTRFYRRRGSTYGSQTANTLALAFGLAPAGTEAKIAASLARHVADEHRGHFNAGIHGLRHLFDQLCRHGQESAAWQALQAEDFPGFKQHFAFGATTFWEVFYNPWWHTMHDRSLNHPMQAAFAAWFFHGIGGIRPDPLAPGFKHFTLQPHLWQQLTFAEASYESVRGLITSRWERDGEKFTWHLTIPANTTATATLPCKSVSSLRLNQARTDTQRAGKGFVRLTLPPGRHTLESTISA